MTVQSKSSASPTSAIANGGGIPDFLSLGLARYSAPGATPRDAAPWSIVELRDGLELRVSRLIEERLEDPMNAPVLLACGAALENLRLALGAMGFAPETTLLPDASDDDLLATLRAGAAREPGHEERALFGVLEQSLTHGAGSPVPAVVSALVGTRLAPAHTAVFLHAAKSRNCWIDVVGDDCRRTTLAEIVTRAANLTDATRGARSLASVFPSVEPSELAPFEREVLGIESLFAMLGGTVRPGPARARVPSSWSGSAIIDAPFVAVLGTPDDSPLSWMAAGAATQRLLLHATLQHLAATFFVDPIRHPMVRDQLRSMLYIAGEPQVIVRLDEATPVRSTG